MFSFFKGIWQKNWKGKATLIGGTLVLITAITGVIYGVATQAGDVGFMVLDGHVLKWKTLPVLCSYDDSFPDEHMAHYDKARTEINQRARRVLISMCIPWQIDDKMPDHIGGSVTLHVQETNKDATFESPFTAHAGGVTKHKYDKRTGEILSALVLIDPKLTNKQTEATWLHELCHVLGLDHDRTRDSIMFPTLQDRPTKLSDKDVKALVDAYGSQKDSAQ